MTHEEAFLEDIREHPDDDAPRLIFADWLEENGDQERAEFIRARIACARAEGPDRSQHFRRSRELLNRNCKRWVAPLARLVGHEPYEPWITSPGEADIRFFPRGFLDEITMDARRFLDNAEELFAIAPLQVLALRGGGGLGEELAACPWLKWICKVSFIDYFRSPLEATDAVCLAASPHLGRLRVLNLARNNIGDAGVAALARSPSLCSLKELCLTENGLSAQGVEALATAPTISLQELWLPNNSLGDEAAAHLAEAPWLRQLRRLNLENTGISEAAVAALRSRAPRLVVYHE